LTKVNLVKITEQNITDMEIFTNEFVEHLADKLASKPLFTEKFMDALAEKIAAKLAQHTAKNDTVVKKEKKAKKAMHVYESGCGSSYSSYSGGCGSSTPSYTRYERSSGGCGSTYVSRGGC
jgi:hypothetical protein